MMNFVQAPGRRPRLGEAVARDLERRILAGELAPGQLLPTEVRLGTELGVSRTVVRDAIQTLAARGLVEVRQGSGTRVAPAGLAAFEQALTNVLLRSDLTVGDVVEARAALEVALVGMAAESGGPEDWDALQAALDALEAAIDRADWDEAHARHLEFHVGILGAVHLPALELVLRPTHQLVLLSSTPPSPARPAQWEFEAHAAVLAALRRGDAEAARRELRGHYRALEGEDYAGYRAARFRESPSVRSIIERRLS